MRRFTFIIMLLVVMTAGAAKRQGHFFMSLKGQNVTTENIKERFGEWFSLPEGTEWRMVSQRTNRQDMTRIEYRQYVGGVEVEHSQLLLHVKDGRVLTANGTVMEASCMPAASRQYGGVFKGGTPTDMLGRKLYLVYTTDGYRYATKVLSGNRLYWIYTDAETGQELKRIPIHHTAEPAKLTGKSIYSGDVEMDGAYDSQSGTYILHDQQRNIHTMIGAYIPSIQDMVNSHTFLKNMPNEQLPVPEEEMTQELWKEWVEGFDVNEADFTTHVNLNSIYTSSSTPSFTAYIIKNITFDKLFRFDEEGNAIEIKPTLDNPVYYNMEICYGADKEGNGIIQRCTRLGIDNLPLTLNLEDHFDEITEKGVTIRLWSEENFDRFYDEDDEDEEDDDEDDEINRELLATLQLVPDGSGIKVWDTDMLKATITYEPTPAAWSAADIHWGMERTYDFYKEFFERDSYDDEGAPIINLMYLPDDYMEGTFFVGCALNNASAMSAPPYPMIYGSGDISCRPVVELSVMAHEYTHLITTATANLAYIGESGALNESFSDLMAISVKKYVKGNDASWKIGEGIMLEIPNLRDMAYPKLSADGDELVCPDTYEGEYWRDPDDLSSDNGGVHYNSGVQNKWYYLLTDGGTGTNDNGYSYDITGIGIEKSQQIAYLTLTEYATEESQYADIRLASYTAAQDIFGDESVEAQTVLQAWDAVGVIDEDNPPTGISDAMHNDQKQIKNGKFYDLQGREITQPSSGIYVKDGRKVVVR